MTTSDKERGGRHKVQVAGFVPPIATPFRDGRLDVDSLKHLLEDVVPHVSGVLVGGSVGEVASLTIEERVRLMQEVASYLDRDSFLVVSIADNSLENSRRLADAAGEVGAHLLVASCPNYYVTELSMLEAYFAALSEFASADLCLYDNPLASHTVLSVADIQALARAAPRLTHIKVTDTALNKVGSIRTETSLTVHSGDDVVLWHQLARGAEGAMVALPMIYPDHAERLWKHFRSGDLESAYGEYKKMAGFINVSLGAPDYVAVIKTVLHHRGVIASPEVRLPLQRPSRRRCEEVRMSFSCGALTQEREALRNG